MTQMILLMSAVILSTALAAPVAENVNANSYVSKSLPQVMANNILNSIGKSLAQHGERASFDVDTGSTKVLSLVQSLFLKVLQPQPIIDNIQEEDKYGNDGERFAVVGRQVVGGVERLTTLLASTVDVPVNVLKSFTRKTTSALNDIGAKLVGLS